MSRRFISIVCPEWKRRVARRFISIVCPEWKRRVARSYISIVTLMEKESGS